MLKKSGEILMAYEYRQMVVGTKGWLDIKLSDEYLASVNQLARQGWEVDQMVPIHTGISGTSAVVILLRRELQASSSKLQVA